MAHQISSVPDAHENGINKIRDKGSDLLHDSRIANTSETGTHLPGDNRRLYKVCWDDMTELEDPEKYRAGGFHPVNIDTYLDLEERFEVHHKLGYGHYGTVWACFDTKKEDWVAIKILQHRDSNENCPELRLLEQLAGISVEELEENHIFLAREYFWLSGPNGRHLCLVNPLLGPSIRDVEDVGLHTPELLTDICFQICKAISFLHSKGICHGDISPGNILFQLDQEAIMEDELSGRQLERYLGEVLAFDLATTWGGTTAPYGPEKLYLRGSTEQLEQKYRTGKIAIIDFGLSYLSKDDPNEGLDFQISYAAPELLTTTGHGGPSTDVWALAATLFEIRTGRQFIDDDTDEPVLLSDLSRQFGPYPENQREGLENVLSILDVPCKPIWGEKVESSSEADEGDVEGRVYLPKDNAEWLKMRQEYIKGSGWDNPLQAQLARMWTRMAAPDLKHPKEDTGGDINAVKSAPVMLEEITELITSSSESPVNPGSKVLSCEDSSRELKAVSAKLDHEQMKQQPEATTTSAAGKIDEKPELSEWEKGLDEYLDCEFARLQEWTRRDPGSWADHTSGRERDIGFAAHSPSLRSLVAKTGDVYISDSETESGSDGSNGEGDNENTKACLAGHDKNTTAANDFQPNTSKTDTAGPPNDDCDRHSQNSGCGTGDIRKARHKRPSGASYPIPRKRQHVKYSLCVSDRDLVGIQLQEDGHKLFGYKFHRLEINRLADLLNKMFKMEPTERIDVEEVLKHSWFEDR